MLGVHEALHAVERTIGPTTDLEDRRDTGVIEPRHQPCFAKRSQGRLEVRHLERHFAREVVIPRGEDPPLCAFTELAQQLVAPLGLEGDVRRLGRSLRRTTERLCTFGQHQTTLVTLAQVTFDLEPSAHRQRPRRELEQDFFVRARHAAASLTSWGKWKRSQSSSRAPTRCSVSRSAFAKAEPDLCAAAGSSTASSRNRPKTLRQSSLIDNSDPTSSTCERSRV